LAANQLRIRINGGKSVGSWTVSHRIVVDKPSSFLGDATDPWGLRVEASYVGCIVPLSWDDCGS
jgi:hypothetical protein